MSLISIPFLICLGVTLLSIGVIFILFTQRLQEQNHKISTMTSLVSTLAEEMFYMKEHMSRSNTEHTKNVFPFFPGYEPLEKKESDGIQLIPVSDDDASDKLDDDDDEDDDENDDEDDDDDDNDEDDDDVEELHNDADEGERSNIDDAKKGTRLISLIDSTILNCVVEEDEDIVSVVDNLDDVEIDENEELISETNIDVIDFNFTKSIDIGIDVSNLEENKDHVSNDYKKLTTQKLKDIAVTKGLIEPNSKANKSQIIKLLESSE
jgi:hypothetical protein